MKEAIEGILTEREQQLAQRLSPRRGVIASAVLHVSLFSSLLLLPLLNGKEAEPLEFVPVQIVPIQALGVLNPSPEAPAKEPAREPEPETDTKQPEPAPEKPALPSPDKKAPNQPKADTRSAEQDAPAPSAAASPGADVAQRQGSPLGSSLGTSQFGAAVGGLDNPDFVYSYYIDQMLAMISANWQRPSLGGEVEAMIHYRIHRDGRITDVEVVSSSGYNSFDLAGLRAIKLAAPFPKLPQSFRHESLGVNLILR